MYCLETFKHLNNVADIEGQLKENPMVRLNQAGDIGNSPDYSGIDLALLEEASGKKIVNTYFVDSSGFGRSGEPAMTHDHFMAVVADLVHKHGKGNLFSCLTGIGQFQVYVTILRRK